MYWYNLFVTWPLTYSMSNLINCWHLCAGVWHVNGWIHCIYIFMLFIIGCWHLLTNVANTIQMLATFVFHTETSVILVAEYCQTVADTLWRLTNHCSIMEVSHVHLPSMHPHGMFLIDRSQTKIFVTNKCHRHLTPTNVGDWTGSNVLSLLQEEMVYEWLNPVYLKADVQEQIREKFEADSEIELRGFLKVFINMWIWKYLLPVLSQIFNTRTWVKWVYLVTKLLFDRLFFHSMLTQSYMYIYTFTQFCMNFDKINVLSRFSALTLLVGWQKEHPACKKLDVGLLILWLTLHIL